MLVHRPSFLATLIYAIIIGALSFAIVYFGLNMMGAHMPIGLTYLNDATAWTADLLALPLPPSFYIYVFNGIITITAATILVFESSLMGTIVYPVALAVNFGLVYWLT